MSSSRSFDPHGDPGGMLIEEWEKLEAFPLVCSGGFEGFG